MKKENIKITPGSASEWYDLGVSLMRQTRFGDAINAFQESARLADAGGLEDIKKKSLASVEVIRDIIGFVNKDLMNP
ncbi:MAG: tetratricopeptide repeat protein [Candidatus Cryptobacteroides sp.]